MFKLFLNSNYYPSLKIYLPIQFFPQCCWPLFSIVLYYPNYESFLCSFQHPNVNSWLTLVFTILPHTHSINIPLVVSLLLQQSSKTGKLIKCFLWGFIMTVLDVLTFKTIDLAGSNKNQLLHCHIYHFFHCIDNSGCGCGCGCGCIISGVHCILCFCLSIICRGRNYFFLTFIRFICQTYW